MAEAEAGLELPIGLTEQKFLQALARIEARSIKTAKRAEAGFVKSNADITKSFGKMSNSARANLQNVSFQLQDIFVQIAGGQGVTRALGQQLPQLLGGFGALGAGIGVAVAAMPTLIGLFSDAEEEAGDLKETVAALEEALQFLVEAQKDLSTPVDELIDKYRTLSGVMREAYEEQLRIAERSLKSKSGDLLEGITDQIDVEAQDASAAAYQQTIDAVTRALEQGIITQEEYNQRVAELGDYAAPTVNLLDELDAALASVASAESLEDYARAWADVRDFIEANRATLEENGVAVDELIAQANDLTIKFGDAHAAASEIAGAIDVATGSAGALQGAMAGVAANARDAAAAIQLAVGSSFAAPKLDRFGNGEDITRRAGGADLQEQQDFRYKWLAQLEEAQKAARSGGSGRRRSGGRKSSGGSGGSGRQETPFFGDIERDLVNLERQIELVGKSSEEVAALKARWELLDEAKKRGLNVDEALNAQIDAQSAKVGQLTAELERAEIAQDQFEAAVDGIADAMSGALVAGESLREGLAQVFKQIASDILSSGIRQALASSFAPTGGGGGGFGSIIGSLFGGFRANGGPVDAGKAYVVGERGPEIVVPGRNSTVIPNHAISGGGNGSVSMTIDLRGTTGDKELDAKIARAGKQILSQVPSVMDDRDKRSR